MDEPTRDLLTRLVEQGPQANLALFLEFVDEAPEDAWLAASALRLLARAGEIPDEGIPALGAALEESPDLGCFTHLSKALAAFGRRAASQSERVIAQLEDIHLTDDARFWSFDSGLHALGYLGGEGASAFVETLASESPSRVERAKGVYTGELDLDERKEWFRASIESVRARLSSTDPGTWSKKQTKKVFGGPVEAEKKLSPWMVR